MRVLLRDFGTALCVGLVLVSAMFMQAPPAGAAISGSAHDFTGDGVQDYRTGSLGPLTPYGSCSACHVAHRGGDISGTTLTLPGTYAVPYRLWPRNLSDEANYFDQYDSDPVYLSSPALMCYDCHDNQNTAVELPVDPETTSWPVNSIYGAPAIGDPQDIALGDYPGGQGSGKVGYYEMYDGSMPSNPAQTDITGGHFWQRPDAQLIGSPAVAQGEKLSCRLCHEPHDEGTQQVSGESQSMFRTQYWDGSAWNSFPAGNFAYGQSNGGLYSSYNTRAHSDETPDANNHGRNLCSACHGYSNQGNPVTMYSQQVPSPPAFISAHDTSSQVACTNCHRHNKILISCDECHGYPPLTGGHPRHLDALGGAFRCELCHGPNPGPGSGWHPDPDTVTAVVQANVNLMGETAFWEPAGYPGTLTAAYNGFSDQGPGAPPVQPGYSFSVMGGGDQRCSSFACHGGTPNTVGALNWTDDMLDEATGSFIGPTDGRNICTWCHDGSPATIDGGTAYAPRAMGDGTYFGFEISGHGLPSGSNYDLEDIGDGLGAAGANLDCDTCHDATYAAGAPTRTHFGVGTDPRDEKRLRARINDTVDNIGTGTTYPTGPDQACEACHQNGDDADGFDISHHGNDTSQGYIRLEAEFRRACRSCHEVHGNNFNGNVPLGNTSRNLHMVGKYLDVDGNGQYNSGDGAFVDSNVPSPPLPPAFPVPDITTSDNAVVFTSFTGLNSFDEVDSAIPPDSAAQNADDICGTCHVPGAGGIGTGGGDHEGTPNLNTDLRGTNCMDCHDHDYDEDYLTPDGFMPSACEGCHGNPPHVGLDMLPGTCDDAPNVMGDGVSIGGTGTIPKRFDDGTFGYNVNGHGANGTADNTPTAGMTFPDLECTECHNISEPSSPTTHLDGTLDTKVFPGSSPCYGPATANTSHLIPAIFFGSITNESSYQTNFDAACYSNAACHGTSPTIGHRHRMPPNVMVRFGSSGSTLDPKAARPLPYWTPWTISDITDAAELPPSSYHWAPCIACHDPHGTNLLPPPNGTWVVCPDAPDGVNHMVVEDFCDKPYFCNSNCHLP